MRAENRRGTGRFGWHSETRYTGSPHNMLSSQHLMLWSHK